MANGHHHHHHHHGADLQAAGALRGIYILSIVLNLSFVFVEAGIGLWKGSLGLLSDAGHNLGDVFSLLLALIAFKLSATRPNERFTYGYRKGSVLISLLNAIILLVAVGAILMESVRKFAHPAPVDGSAVAWTAAAGILVNGLTAFLLMRHQKNDINTRGAFLHMAADTLVSVGVVISGIVISLTGWTVIDPIVSVVIAVVILVSTWRLLSESVRMSIDAVPESVSPSEVLAEMLEVQGVSDVHHLHIWPISTTETALTAHIVLSEGAESEEVVPEVKKHLKHCGISHATLETEREGHACGEQECC
ncbi:MAG: cation transporter [Bacteroidales bacterium]|nr:cation transporter [Bacteroidales bacterium]MBP5522122.1 cation transporter [Bacteroidales bacterium]